MRIYIRSVRELAEVILDELLVVVDLAVFGEIPPRSIRQAARQQKATGRRIY